MSLNPVLLRVVKLVVSFGGLVAVDQVDLTIKTHEIIGLVGPNGAGKSTLFNALTGLVQRASGHILLNEQPLRRPMTAGRLLQCLWMVALSCGVCVLVHAGPQHVWQVAINESMRLQWAWDNEHAATSTLIPLGGVGHFVSATQMLSRAADVLVGAPHIGWADGHWGVWSYDHAHKLAQAVSPSEAVYIVQRLAPVQRQQTGGFLCLRLWPLIVGTVLGLGAASTFIRRSQVSPSWLARQGLARTFQNLRLFLAMDVRDNVRVAIEAKAGMNTAWRAGIPGVARLACLCVLSLVSFAATQGPHSAHPALCAFLLPTTCLLCLGLIVHLWADAEATKTASAASDAKADALLQQVGLLHLAQASAGDLSYGQMRRLEIARALALEPRLLLLDEPAAGLNAQETKQLRILIESLRVQGLTVVLIEHDMELVMNVCDRIVVLNHGQKIADATPDEVRKDPKVIAAYLGSATSVLASDTGAHLCTDNGSVDARGLVL